MNTCRIFPTLLFAILLTSAGCSGVQQPAPTDNNSQGETTTLTTNNTQKSGEGELEQLIDQVAAQARQTMRTHKTKLNDVVIEATPMWSPNYQGEVHIRVYDASGKLVLDEYRK